MMPRLWTTDQVKPQVSGTIGEQSGSRIATNESDSLATFLSEQKGA